MPAAGRSGAPARFPGLPPNLPPPCLFPPSHPVPPMRAVMKSVDDAQRLRARISRVIEHAGLPHLTPEERRRHLSFVVVGGGPTGCAARGPAPPAGSCRLACGAPPLEPWPLGCCPLSTSPTSHPSRALPPFVVCSVELAAELHDFVQEDVSRLLPHLKVPACRAGGRGCLAGPPLPLPTVGAQGGCALAPRSPLLPSSWPLMVPPPPCIARCGTITAGRREDHGGGYHGPPAGWVGGTAWGRCQGVVVRSGRGAR